MHLHWEGSVWGQTRGFMTNMAHLSPLVSYIFMWTLFLSLLLPECLVEHVCVYVVPSQRKDKAELEICNLIRLQKDLRYCLSTVPRTYEQIKKLTGPAVFLAHYLLLLDLFFCDTLG